MMKIKHKNQISLVTVSIMSMAHVCILVGFAGLVK